MNDALDGESRLVANLAAKASHAQQVLEVLNAPDAQRVTLTATKTPPAPTAHTVYLADRGALVMEASNLKPVAAGKTYELWVIPASGAAPVPAGTFTPNARGLRLGCAAQIAQRRSGQGLRHHHRKRRRLRHPDSADHPLRRIAAKIDVILERSEELAVSTRCHQTGCPILTK